MGSPMMSSKTNQQKEKLKKKGHKHEHIKVSDGDCVPSQKLEFKRKSKRLFLEPLILCFTNIKGLKNNCIGW